jgi:quercetin dioxygenase-like cupin family protein
MQVIAAGSVAFRAVEADGASGCRMAELITAATGAPTFAMRQFEVDPGGRTPFHAHPWEHEVFILAGAGCVETEAEPRQFAAGDAVFIPRLEKHAFRNTGEDVLRFLCLIPVAEPCCR